MSLHDSLREAPDCLLRAMWVVRPDNSRTRPKQSCDATTETRRQLPLALFLASRKLQPHLRAVIMIVLVFTFTAELLRHLLRPIQPQL
jgi:hypothetical protein